jgi:hypothetical protein
LPSYDIFAHTFSQFVSRSESVPAFVICVDVSWFEIASSENESTDNIGLPTYTSSPIQINQTQSSSTTKKKQSKNKKDSHT